MRVLSLFDGISCGRVALEELGLKIDYYEAYEIDDNAIKVALHNYPDIVEKGNVFDAKYTEDSFDLLMGGSPCTYWSIAKAGSGRETTASGVGFDLFKEYVRALREVKPKWFLYENNASMSEDIKKAITKELGVEPIFIDSADFSAQNRKRLYWTNIPVDKNWTKSTLVFKDIEFDFEYKEVDMSMYKDTLRVSKDGTYFSWDSSGKGYYSQHARARSKDIKMNTLTTGSGKNNIWLGNYKYRRLHPVEAERLQMLPDNYTACLTSKDKRISACGNGWTVSVIKHIFSYLTTL